MRVKKYLALGLVLPIIGVSSVVSLAQSSGSSIGVSPPYITNENLLPGSSFSQKIVISRVKPTNDARAEIKLDIEEPAKNWITFSKGLSFNLPSGEQRHTIIASVVIPEDAELGNYKGYARISLKDTDASGQVVFLPAVRLDIDLNVGNVEEKDLKVDFADIEDYPANASLILLIKMTNHGNVSTSPDKVKLDIISLTGELLTTVESESIPEIESFATNTVKKEFEDVSLLPADYFANVYVYDDEERIYKDKIAFKVLDDDPSFLGANTSQGIISKTYNKLGKVLFWGGTIVTLGTIGFLLFLFFKRRKKEQERKR